MHGMRRMLYYAPAITATGVSAAAFTAATGGTTSSSLFQYVMPLDQRHEW